MLIGDRSRRMTVTAHSVPAATAWVLPLVEDHSKPLTLSKFGARVPFHRVVGRTTREQGFLRGDLVISLCPVEPASWVIGCWGRKVSRALALRINPEAYLKDVLVRISTTPMSQIASLRPRNWVRLDPGI